MSADCHIVANLDLIVDFGALADHGVAQAAAIDGRAGADLHIVLDQDAAGLRHLQMAIRPEKDEAIAVLTDTAAGMDQHVVANQRALNRRMRADVAVPADPDIDTDHGARTDDRPGADFDVRTNHGKRIDNHPIFQTRRRIDDGGWSDAVIAEPGLRAKRVAMQHAGNLHKVTERMGRAQHRDMGGDAGLEATADQTGPRFRRSKLAGVFQIVEKRQMHRAGFFQRRQPPDLFAAPRRLGQKRRRQRSDIGQRRKRRLFKECRLRHSTRRGPAGDRTRASVLIDQNRALFSLTRFLHANRYPISLENALERCPAAKLELLHAVVRAFGERHRIVKAQRTEWRGPDQTDTHRGANEIAVIERQSGTGSGRDWISCWANTAGHVDFTRLYPRCRPLVVPQRTGIGVHGALKPDFLRQEPERHLQLRRRAPILGAAKRILRTEWIDVARTDAVRGKATDEVRTHLEMIQHSDIAAHAVQDAALDVDQTDNVRDQRCVILCVDRRLQIAHVAAQAGEILLEINVQAVGRVLVVVQRIVIQRIADRRRQGLASLKFLAHRQRRFAVGEAAQTSAGRVNGTRVRRDKRRGRIEGEQAVPSDNVVTVGKVGRQLNLLLIDRVPKLQRQIFAQPESEPRTEAEGLGAVRNEVVRQLLTLEEVETERNAIVQKIRLDQRKRVTARELAIRHRRLRKQAAAKEVTFGNADLRQRTIGGRIAARYREVAGRFLFEIDNENHTIAGRSGFGGDFHALEEIKVLQPALGTIDQRPIIRVAFRKIEFAANDVVPGAGIAAHVDALDVGSRAFVDGEGD